MSITTETLPQLPESAMTVAQRRSARRKIIARNKHKRRVPLKAAFTVKATKGAKK